MGWNDNGLVLGDDATHFLFTVLDNEAAKAADVNILATGEGVFHYRKKAFQGSRYISLVNSGFLRDFYDYFRFRHVDLNY